MMNFPINVSQYTLTSHTLEHKSNVFLGCPSVFLHLILLFIFFNESTGVSHYFAFMRFDIIDRVAYSPTHCETLLALCEQTHFSRHEYSYQGVSLEMDKA